MITETLEKPIKLTDRQKAFLLLRENGENPGRAAEAVGYHKSTGYYLEKRLKKYDLTSESFVKGAVKTVRQLMRGETFGTLEKVKDSTALAAAGMILDRSQPIIHRTESLNLNADLSFVDLRKYRQLDTQSSGQGGGNVETQGVTVETPCECEKNVKQRQETGGNHPLSGDKLACGERCSSDGPSHGEGEKRVGGRGDEAREDNVTINPSSKSDKFFQNQVNE